MSIGYFTEIFLLTQSTCRGYDTYDSCVVAAKDCQSARLIRPSGMSHSFISHDWPTEVDDITVELIGAALPNTKEGMILASFNAG